MSQELIERAYRAGYLKATGMDGWDKMDHELRAIEREASAYAATLCQAARVDEGMVDRVAKAIADAVGNGMREKYEAHARAAIAALSAQPAMNEPSGNSGELAQPAERQGECVPRLMARDEATFIKPEFRGAYVAGWNDARTWVLTHPAAPVGVPDGMVLVRKASLSYWQRELNGARQGDNAQQRAEIVHSGIAAYLAAAPSAPQGNAGLGIPSCGKPLCSENDHHPLCPSAPQGVER